MLRKFYHYSLKEIDNIRDSDQCDKPTMKPKGFWVSDCNSGDGWHDWCQAEQWGLEGLAYRYLAAVDMSEILLIDTSAGIQKLHDDYFQDTEFSLYSMDWPQLAKKYKGIVISPYQWSMRLNGPSWYYGWDCASGCIWDVGAIVSFTRDKNWRYQAAA